MIGIEVFKSVEILADLVFEVDLLGLLLAIELLIGLFDFVLAALHALQVDGELLCLALPLVATVGRVAPIFERAAALFDVNRLLL